MFPEHIQVPIWENVCFKRLHDGGFFCEGSNGEWGGLPGQERELGLISYTKEVVFRETSKIKSTLPKTQIAFDPGRVKLETHKLRCRVDRVHGCGADVEGPCVFEADCGFLYLYKFIPRSFNLIFFKDYFIPHTEDFNKWIHCRQIPEVYVPPLGIINSEVSLHLNNYLSTGGK